MFKRFPVKAGAALLEKVKQELKQGQPRDDETARQTDKSKALQALKDLSRRGQKLVKNVLETYPSLSVDEAIEILNTWGSGHEGTAR